MRRGEIRWYAFKPPDKKRPVMILTRDSAIPYLNEVTIAPITSTIRDIPSEIILGPQDGMPVQCAVNFDHIQTVSKDRIGDLLITLPVARMKEVGPAICFALGLDQI